MRAISDSFKHALLEGSLKPVLQAVQQDDDLDMELRGEYITVYYRGGRLFSVCQKESKFVYQGIDKQYVKDTVVPDVMQVDILNYIGQCKRIVDRYIQESSKNHLGEKEIQQMVVKENNYSPVSADTDYFIIDMEYQDGGRRFDLVALRWDSTTSARKRGKVSLAVIEVKQGFKTIRSAGDDSSGLRGHQKDFYEFLEDNAKKEAFCEDMLSVFLQKYELGLIRNIGHLSEKIKNIDMDKTKIDFICLLANYKPNSRELVNELEEMEECRFFISSFMGYGLYSKCVVEKEYVLNLLK